METKMKRKQIVYIPETPVNCRPCIHTARAPIPNISCCYYCEPSKNGIYPCGSTYVPCSKVRAFKCKNISKVCECIRREYSFVNARSKNLQECLFLYKIIKDQRNKSLIMLSLI